MRVLDIRLCSANWIFFYQFICILGIIHEIRLICAKFSNQIYEIKLIWILGFTGFRLNSSLRNGVYALGFWRLHRKNYASIIICMILTSIESIQLSTHKETALISVFDSFLLWDPKTFSLTHVHFLKVFFFSFWSYLLLIVNLRSSIYIITKSKAFQFQHKFGQWIRSRCFFLFFVFS